MAKSFKVKRIRSISGCTQTQIDTVHCLGLRKINTERTFKDSPAVRGQIRKIQHMVEVTIVK